MQEASQPQQTKFKRMLFVLVLLVLMGSAVVLVRKTQQSFLEEVAVELSPQTPQRSSVRPTREVIGKAAPDFDLISFGSTSSVQLFNLRGTPVVLLFFASWSDASLDALKTIDTLWPELERNGIAVFALSTLEPKDAATRIQGRLGLHVQLLIDEDGTVGETYQVSTLPSMFFIARDGILMEEVVGGMESETVRAKAFKLLE